MSKILIAVDDTKSSKSILSALNSFFLLPEKVILLHVQRLEGRSMMIDMLGDAEISTLKEMLRDTEYKDKLDQVSEKIMAHYKSKLNEYGLTNVKAIRREGVPDDEILRVAGEEGVNMILLGDGEKKGLNRLILGSVAKSVKRRSKVPVLIARRTAMKAKAETSAAFLVWILTAALYMFLITEIILQKDIFLP